MRTLRYIWTRVLLIAGISLTLISCDESSPAPLEPIDFLYEETFEGSEPFSTAYNKEVGTWDYALQFVSDPVYQGNYCARFEVRADQPLIAEGKRSEVSIIRWAEGQLTNSAWYSFAVYFPSVGYEYDHTHDVISQWLDYPDGSPIRLLTKGNQISMEVGNAKGEKINFEIGELTKDTWHEFVFHIIHSPVSNGLIELWHNNKLIVNYQGGNQYNTSLPKWKIGLHKASFEYGTSGVTRRIIYFDNIRVSDERASYQHMKPGG